MDLPTRTTQRGTVLVSTLFFSLMAVGVIALALTRATTEASYGEWTSKRTRALYEADALLTRAHAIINGSPYDGAHRNLALWDTASLETLGAYGVPSPVTLALDLGGGAFEDSQVEVSRRQALPDATGAYPLLPEGWYRLEVGVQAPDYDVNGTPIVRKRVRQYVRERRTFSKFSIYVSDDNLGIAGFTTNPGQLLEGQIHTNKTLYFYYANRYYPRRLTSVLGKGYAVGATAANTYLLHPQNDFASPVISLPPVSELLDPSYLPNPETLYGKAIGSAPFTLLEVVMASTIFVVILGISLGSYQAAFAPSKDLRARSSQIASSSNAVYWMNQEFQ